MNAIEYIKSQTNKEVISSVLSNYASNIVDTGDGFRCNCPIHHGDNPTAFYWNYENGLWFCHSGSCGGGDIFDFIASVNNMDIDTQFRKVVVKTSEETGISIDGLSFGEKTTKNRRDTRNWVEYMLSQKKQENLEFDIRKIGGIEPIESYRNFTKATIDHFSGGYSNTYERIAIPLYNEEDVMIGISLRRTNKTDKAKWLHIPKHLNTRLVIYNLSKIEGDKIILTEGSFDVWNLHQIGISNTGATLGAHITKEQEQILLKRFINVELMFDKDKAGIKATLKAIDQLKNKVNLTIRDLGEYNDPGDIPNKEAYDELPVLRPYEYVKKYVTF